MISSKYRRRTTSTFQTTYKINGKDRKNYKGHFLASRITTRNRTNNWVIPNDQCIPVGPKSAAVKTNDPSDNKLKMPGYNAPEKMEVGTPGTRVPGTGN